MFVWDSGPRFGTLNCYRGQARIGPIGPCAGKQKPPTARGGFCREPRGEIRSIRGIRESCYEPAMIRGSETLNS